jgi:hypothetical protein
MHRVIPPEVLSAAPGAVVFWSGAGVSKDAPSNGPLGEELSRRVLACGFADGLLDRMQRAYARLEVNRSLPRLETLLDVAIAEHGLPLLPTLLADLVSMPPNPSHQFFAEHLRAGGFHATANFDTCIEKAGGDELNLVHFHERLRPGDDGGSLGARLSQIERGFDPTLKQRLTDGLKTAAVVVVVGYRGLDFFDVDPYWRELNDHRVLEGRVVLWVEHASFWKAIGRSQRSHHQLADFDRGGAVVYEIEAPTRQLLKILATTWGFAPLTDPPPVPTSAPLLPSLTDVSRDHANLRFFAYAGLDTEVQARLAGRPLSPEEHGWAAEAAWAAGRYREADDHWAKSRPGDSADDRAFRDERHAAVLWIRGELRRAYASLSVAFHDSRVHGADPEQRLVMAETLGRILVHMSRLPDTRWMATKTRREQALRRISDSEAELTRPLGVHLRIRIDSVRAALLRQPVDPERGDPVEGFQETEALMPMLNYRYASLRAQATSTPTRLSPQKYWRQVQQFEVVGASGDAARVPFLPGGETAFAPNDVWPRVKAVDFTRWHRARLFTYWLGLWAIEKVPPKHVIRRWTSRLGR